MNIPQKCEIMEWNGSDGCEKRSFGPVHMWIFQKKIKNKVVI